VSNGIRTNSSVGEHQHPNRQAANIELRSEQNASFENRIQNQNRQCDGMHTENNTARANSGIHRHPSNHRTTADDNGGQSASFGGDQWSNPNPSNRQGVQIGFNQGRRNTTVQGSNAFNNLQQRNAIQGQRNTSVQGDAFNNQGRINVTAEGAQTSFNNQGQRNATVQGSNAFNNQGQRNATVQGAHTTFNNQGQRNATVQGLREKPIAPLFRPNASNSSRPNGNQSVMATAAARPNVLQNSGTSSQKTMK
jgi:hypothetical protein